MNEYHEDDSSKGLLIGLRVFAVATGVAALTQLVLGLGIITNIGSVYDLHTIIGYVTLAVAVIAAVMAVLWKRVSGNKGLMFHAIGVAVLTVAQVGLGASGVRLPHIILGVLIAIAAVALATLSLRPHGLSAKRRSA